MDDSKRKELIKNSAQIREQTKILGRDAELQAETQLLTAAWSHHSEDLLRDYLVRGYQDPTINFQSILWRHFLTDQLFGTDFSTDLKAKEKDFSAKMNAELRLEQHRVGKEFAVNSTGSTDAQATEQAHRKVMAGVEDGLREEWAQALSGASKRKSLSVIEAACGSANDYRALAAWGIADHLDYVGFDLTENNIKNASSMYPKADFRLGNVLEIDADDSSFDVTFADALFEHLSPVGFDQGIREMCRVARNYVFINFFYMAEIDEHKIKPLRSYHYNTLSRARIEAIFHEEGWGNIEIIEVHPLLSEIYDFHDTFNKFTYTFIAQPS